MLTPIYTIYKITNTINQKIYIGVHKTTNPHDNYMGSGLHIKRSIKKHGKENFKKDILFEYNNPDDAYLKETKLVNELFVNRKDTYNINVGGNKPPINMGHSDETKLKLKHAKLGIRLSPNHIKSLIDNHVGMTGKHHSDESKLKMTGKNNPEFKGYYITPWGTFESVRSAEIHTIKRVAIFNWCKTNNHKQISHHNVSKSKYLKSLNESPIGKTFKEIGFNFIPV